MPATTPARRARAAVPRLALVLATAGCSAEAAAPFADPRPPGSTARPEWERDVTHRDGTSLPPTAFRAGHGLAAALYGDARYEWKFVLAERGHPGSGGPARQPSASEITAAKLEPTDVVGISRTGAVWFLDRAMGTVVSEDVGGMGTVVARVGRRGTVRTACALGERAIAFLDDARSGHVLVRALAPSSPVRALALPDHVLEGAAVPWETLRFGGSADGGCVLWAPRLPTALLVTDSVVRALGAFVEPLPPDPGRRWTARLARLLRLADPAPPPPGALDATTVPGSVAVLHAGRTPSAGRLVDLYDDSGRYVGTLRLPRVARRIAGTGGRLLAIGADRDGAYIASFVLPASRRRTPVADEPDVLAPRWPAGAASAAEDDDARP